MAQNFQELMNGQRRGLWAGLQRAGLRLASIPYGWGMRCRNWLFDNGWKESWPAGVPVVSVGNLTVGGTGKTPCVEYVARFYRGLERRVAILSRGYGAQRGRNDEALVLEENLPDVPHLQGADRVALAQIAIEELESEVLVLDDGFQHRRLRRDLDLVLIDSTAPWGHGYLLPRGLLREPRTSLGRAHAALLTRCDQVGPEVLRGISSAIHRFAPTLAVVETIHQPREWLTSKGETIGLEQWRGRPAAGFCGLGNPEAFRATLAQLGLGVVQWRTFPDHHDYTRTDVDDLRAWAAQLPPDGVVATTQKDLVKIGLDSLGDRPLAALKIQMAMRQGQEILEDKLRGVLVTAEK